MGPDPVLSLTKGQDSGQGSQQKSRFFKFPNSNEKYKKHLIATFDAFLITKPGS